MFELYATERIRAVAVLAHRALWDLRRVVGDRVRGDESGNVITDNLAWIVFGVLAVVAIGALIQALGANVIGWVTKELGISS